MGAPFFIEVTMKIISKTKLNKPQRRKLMDQHTVKQTNQQSQLQISTQMYRFSFYCSYYFFSYSFFAYQKFKQKRFIKLGANTNRMCMI